MTTEAVDLARLADTLEALRREVGRLNERVAALEATRSAGVPPASGALAAETAALRQAPPTADGLSEELVLVISAAIAAYLGKKPHIRQIRLLRSDAWAQQGRATIQASHALSVSATRRAP
jgi:methylmalonyl-CoA carboxyltransferase large subunit